MTMAGIPLVRVEIDTDQATADLWAKARSINPSKMEWAVHVRSVRTTEGWAHVTVAVSQNTYADYVAGVGFEDVSSAIESVLSSDANEIVQDHDATITFDTISMATPSDAYEPHAFIVQWDRTEVAGVVVALGEATNRLKEIRITRLTPLVDDKAWFIVLVPEFLYIHVIEAYLDRHGPQDIAECLWLAVSEALHPYTEPELEPRIAQLPIAPSQAEWTKSPIDDDIPF
ncbi:MAG: hypothetical protein ABL901_03875 [Hyphomicrobiaceae bacterium]